MLLVFVATCLFYLDGVSMLTSDENHCKDQKIQEHIDIKQLTGMWFAIEIISHLQESPTYYQEPTTTETEICAVISISDRPRVPFSPIYKDFNENNQSYGSRYTVYQTQEPYPENPSNQYQTTNRNWLHKQQRYRQHPNNKHNQLRNDISITWDEALTTTFYAAYYTEPVGHWYIYPSTIDEYSTPKETSHLAGNIQVLKAVGNHMVLTFCLKSEPKFFTVILSRWPKLSQEDISGVHNLLRRLELDFVKTRRMCLLNNSNRISIHFALLSILGVIITIV